MSAPAATARPETIPIERRPPVRCGKPISLLEDAEKNAFTFSAGQWKPFDKSIAACRVDCLVKELPQKINGLIRYKVSAPI